MTLPSQPPAPSAAPGPSQPATPPKKQRIGLIVTLTIVACLLPALIGGGIFALVLNAEYQSIYAVAAKPNADRLTALPTGAAPAGIGRMAGGENSDGSGWSYDRVGGADRIDFREHPAEYWDARVKGDRWKPAGDDILCEHVEGFDPGFCVMAFSDGALAISFNSEILDQVPALTAEYIARRSGETVEPNWFELTPPNVDRLPSIAAIPEQYFPDRIGGDDPWGGQDFAGAAGPEGPTHWSVGYGDGILATIFTAYTDYSLWGYFTDGSDYTAYGDVLCTEMEVGVRCLLAGSDGMVIAAAQDMSISAEDLVPPLQALANG